MWQFLRHILRSEDHNSHEVLLMKSFAGVFGVVHEQLAGSKLVTINLLKSLHFLDQFVGSKRIHETERAWDVSKIIVLLSSISTMLCTQVLKIKSFQHYTLSNMCLTSQTRWEAESKYCTDISLYRVRQDPFLQTQYGLVHESRHKPILNIFISRAKESQRGRRGGFYVMKLS